jgi:hypothetical protein
MPTNTTFIFTTKSYAERAQQANLIQDECARLERGEKVDLVQTAAKLRSLVQAWNQDRVAIGKSANRELRSAYQSHKDDLLGLTARVNALSSKGSSLSSWVRPIAYTAFTAAGITATYLAASKLDFFSFPTPDPQPNFSPTEAATLNPANANIPTFETPFQAKPFASVSVTEMLGNLSQSTNESSELRDLLQPQEAKAIPTNVNIPISSDPTVEISGSLMQPTDEPPVQVILLQPQEAPALDNSTFVSAIDRLPWISDQWKAIVKVSYRTLSWTINNPTPTYTGVSMLGAGCYSKNHGLSNTRTMGLTIAAGATPILFDYALFCVVPTALAPWTGPFTLLGTVVAVAAVNLKDPVILSRLLVANPPNSEPQPGSEGNQPDVEAQPDPQTNPPNSEPQPGSEGNQPDVEAQPDPQANPPNSEPQPGSEGNQPDVEAQPDPQANPTNAGVQPGSEGNARVDGVNPDPEKVSHNERSFTWSGSWPFDHSSQY